MKVGGRTKTVSARAGVCVGDAEEDMVDQNENGNRNGKESVVVVFIFARGTK